MGRANLREAVRLTAIAAIYFAAGRLGLSVAFVHESASAVWPPTGIALAAMLLYGTRVWPAVFAGAFLVNLTTSGSAAASLGIAIGNTLEAVGGGILVRRYARGLRAFERTDDVFRFAGLAAIGATAISATVGLLSLMLADLLAPGDYGPVWLTWWLGDASGAMLITPLVVLWAQRQHDDPLLARPVEGFCLLATTMAAALVVFGGVSPAGRSQFPLAFLCLPGLLWAAFRFGPREAAACSAILAAIAVSGTLGGYGPYASQGPGQGLVMLQAFVGIVTTTSLAAAAEASQRRQREAELRALNKELEEANHLKDQFLATLSHELRTPLHAVIGWAHMLLRGALDDDKRSRAIELIYRNAMVQSQMISDLLDVSRVTTGTLTLETGVVDLPAIVATAVEAVRPMALDKGIELHTDCREAAWIHGDAKRLGQVANNLLSNAIKFTPCGGRVTIQVATTDADVEIRVEDTGPGIAPDFLPYVFERFRQEDASVTREHGGLGLGLAIVRHIVELHGGRVQARNRCDSPGAVFVVALPAPQALDRRPA